MYLNDLSNIAWQVGLTAKIVWMEMYWNRTYGLKKRDVKKIEEHGSNNEKVYKKVRRNT